MRSETRPGRPKEDQTNRCAMRNSLVQVKKKRQGKTKKKRPRVEFAFKINAWGHNSRSRSKDDTEVSPLKIQQKKEIHGQRLPDQTMTKFRIKVRSRNHNQTHRVRSQKRCISKDVAKVSPLKVQRYNNIQGQRLPEQSRINSRQEEEQQHTSENWRVLIQICRQIVLRRY